MGQVLVVLFGHSFDHSDDVRGGPDQAGTGQAQGAHLGQQRGPDHPLDTGVIVLVVDPHAKNHERARRVGQLQDSQVDLFGFLSSSKLEDLALDLAATEVLVEGQWLGTQSFVREQGFVCAEGRDSWNPLKTKLLQTLFCS